MLQNSKLLWLVTLLCMLAVTGIVVLQRMSWNEANDSELGQLSLSELEQRIAVIDEQLLSLAKPSMRSSVGAVGYRSREHSTAENLEWIRIDFSETSLIDQVVLVPAIWRDSVNGFRADGFPAEFRIVLGKEENDAGTVVSSLTSANGLPSQVAPSVISFPATEASWVRLEANRLSPRGWDGNYVLQLSEILAFSDQENVALGQSVRVSSVMPPRSVSARHQNYLKAWLS